MPSTQVSLVGKLERLQRTLDQRTESGQDQSLEGHRNVGSQRHRSVDPGWAFCGTGTRQDVSHSQGTLARTRPRLKMRRKTPHSLGTQDRSTLGLMPSGSTCMWLDGDLVSILRT
ncbi:unnamed protein product [Lota lota]